MKLQGNRFTGACAMVAIVATLMSCEAGCDRPATPSTVSKAGHPRPRPAAKAVEQPVPRAREVGNVEPTPRVVIHTSQGDIVVRLYRERAGQTVENFLAYVDEGYYNGTIFHQVVEGCIVLGGGFTPALDEKPTRPPIANEAHNGLKNLRGTIAMARRLESIDSSTSQFFINLTDNPTLDHRDDTPEGYGYCVFGEVVAGMDVVDRIAHTEVDSNAHFELLPLQTVLIQSVTRVR